MAENVTPAVTSDKDGSKEWWWSQIPAPLKSLVAILSFLAFVLPTAIFVINQGATLLPSVLVLKNALWPSPPPPRADSPATARPAPVQQPSVRNVIIGVFEGYVYYEVGTDRKPTDDGQLKLANNGPMPDFWDIRPGHKFKAISPVNIRTNPNPANDWKNSGFDTVLGVLSGGECIKVVEGERRRYPVRIAASGGFLPMIRVTCD